MRGAVGFNDGVILGTLRASASLIKMGADAQVHGRRDRTSLSCAAIELQQGSGQFPVFESTRTLGVLDLNRYPDRAEADNGGTDGMRMTKPIPETLVAQCLI
jgi:hypothetical protein